jgi:hypothetical protein
MPGGCKEDTSAEKHKASGSLIGWWKTRRDEERVGMVFL